MSSNVTPIFEANMDAGLRSHFRRTGAEMVDTRMPFDRIITFETALAGEDDGIEGGENGPGDYEMRQRVIGVRALFRLLKARGVTMPQIMKQLFAAGRAVHDPFFSSLTMTESAMMYSETKSAHSWRCKVLSGEIKLTGMRGHRLPGQKNPESRVAYSAGAAGNSNRKGRQASFLRKLKTGPASRQHTFIRKLNGKAKASQEVAVQAMEQRLAQRASKGTSDKKERKTA